jgi:ankyrin repeat protein
LYEEISSIDDRDHHGNDALLLAAKNGHVETFDLVVKKIGQSLLKGDSEEQDTENSILNNSQDISMTEEGTASAMPNQTPSKPDSKPEGDTADETALRERMQVCNHQGRNALLIGAEGGSVRICDHLRKFHGYDASSQTVDNDGNSCLLVACFYGHKDLVEYILTSVPNAATHRNRFGNGMILEAARGGQLELLESLLAPAALEENIALSIGEKNNLGFNALHVACSMPSTPVAMIRRLIASKRLDINDCNLHGQTILHIVTNFDSLTEHRSEIALEALKAGADVMLADHSGQTPVSQCQQSSQQHPESFELLKLLLGYANLRPALTKWVSLAKLYVGDWQMDETSLWLRSEHSLLALWSWLWLREQTGLPFLLESGSDVHWIVKLYLPDIPSMMQWDSALTLLQRPPATEALRLHAEESDILTFEEESVRVAEMKLLLSFSHYSKAFVAVERSFRVLWQGALEAKVAKVHKQGALSAAKKLEASWREQWKPVAAWKEKSELLRKARFELSLAKVKAYQNVEKKISVFQSRKSAEKALSSCMEAYHQAEVQRRNNVEPARAGELKKALEECAQEVTGAKEKLNAASGRVNEWIASRREKWHAAGRSTPQSQLRSSYREPVRHSIETMFSRPTCRMTRSSLMKVHSGPSILPQFASAAEEQKFVDTLTHAATAIVYGGAHDPPRTGSPVRKKPKKAKESESATAISKSSEKILSQLSRPHFRWCLIEQLVALIRSDATMWKLSQGGKIVNLKYTEDGLSKMIARALSTAEEMQPLENSILPFWESYSWFSSGEALQKLAGFNPEDFICADPTVFDSKSTLMRRYYGELFGIADWEALCGGSSKNAVTVHHPLGSLVFWMRPKFENTSAEE